MDIPIMGDGLWNRYKPRDTEAEKRRERCQRDTEIATREQYDFTKEGYRSSSCPDTYRALTEEEKERLALRLGLEYQKVTELKEDKGIKRNLTR